MKKLSQICATLHSRGKTIVTTNGAFDILHIGHIRYLEKAKALGDVLVVGVNSDSSVRLLKGTGRPINGQNERALIVAALGCVDYVSIFNGKLPLEFISKVKPSLHVKGGDYNSGKLPEKALVESLGGSIKIVKFERGYSTTNIIEKIKKGKR